MLSDADEKESREAMEKSKGPTTHDQQMVFWGILTIGFPATGLVLGLFFNIKPFIPCFFFFSFVSLVLLVMETIFTDKDSVL